MEENAFLGGGLVEVLGLDLVLEDEFEGGGFGPMAIDFDKIEDEGRAAVLVGV